MKKFICIVIALTCVAQATSTTSGTTPDFLSATSKHETSKPNRLTTKHPDPLVAIQAKLNTLVSSLNSVNAKLNQHENSLNNFKTSLEGIRHTMNALRTRIGASEKGLAALQSKDRTHNSQIKRNENSINSLNQKLKTQVVLLEKDESKLTNLTDDVKDYSKNVNGLSKQVTNIVRSLDSLNAQILTQKSKTTTNSKNIRSLNITVRGHENRIKYVVDKVKKVESNLFKQIHYINNSTRQALNSHITQIRSQRASLVRDEKTLASLKKDVDESKKKRGKLWHVVNSMKDALKKNNMKVKNEENALMSFGNQLMQQQTFVEERIRSDGMSGIKSVRHSREGTKPYYGDTHIGGSAIACHDHADYDRTIGLGELNLVMNGVDFRTRHNDYKFKMKSSDDKYNSVEDIPFPDVPSEVTDKATIDEQIVEMRKWFKAFKDQDHSFRDYRKYFKPNLCYMEGGWSLNAKTLAEPFHSDRHHLDAASWFDLQEKIRFTSYTGAKSNLENFAYLPTMMYNYTDGVPQMAQWNYRILCHPLKQDVPTSYFELQDDLNVRLARKIKWNKLEQKRSARYKLNEYSVDRQTHYTFLDGLMEEIPGKDNYGNNLTDNSFDMMHYNIKTGKPLSVGYYHRWFKLMKKGAMGLKVNHRGFRDENLWVAMTTQPNIMPLSISKCRGRGKYRHCQYQTARVTYALPLEIVYTTPLQSWNPYNLSHHDEKIVSKDGRNGGHTPDKAFNGTSFRHYYRTPAAFYHDGKTNRDKADTARAFAGVLDPEGQIQRVSPTGFRILSPKIQDVGSVRIRYPIFPVHSEGSTVGEELMALKTMVMQMSKNAKYFEASPMSSESATDFDGEEDIQFELRETTQTPPGLHGHDFDLTADEYKSLINGTDITVTTSLALGHNHQLRVHYNQKKKKFYYLTCDGKPMCWDRHSKELTKN